MSQESIAGLADHARLERGCDRCGATALHEVKLPSGALLKFCNHHYDKHKDKFDGCSVVPLNNGRPADSHPMF